MSTKSVQLEDVLGKARVLAEKDTLTEAEETELAGHMKSAEQIRDSIVRSKSIDDFTRTISHDVTPGRLAESASKSVVLGQEPGTGFKAVADADEFDAAMDSIRSGRKEWGFGVRYKADVDNAVAEVGAGSVPAGSQGPQYGGIVSPYYYPGIIEPPTLTPTIAELFAQGSTDSNLVRLVKETTTTNNSGVSAEGALYGSVKIEVSPVDWPVRDITALMPVTEDIMQDIPALSAYLAMRIGKFVQLAEEAELVSGNASGSHLDGLLHASNTTSATLGNEVAADLMTAAVQFKAQIWSASFMQPTWVVMSPNTWANLITTREDLNGGKGQFLYGPPGQSPLETTWGMRIVVTPTIGDDKAIFGNEMAGMVFRNGGLRVETSTGYGTFFGEGLVAIRAKVRTAFALLRPQAIGILNFAS